MIIILIKPVVDAPPLPLKKKIKTKPVHPDHAGSVRHADDKEKTARRTVERVILSRTPGLRSKGQNQFGLLFKTSPEYRASVGDATSRREERSERMEKKKKK